MVEKILAYYMSLPYRVEIYPEENGSGYTAVIPDLPGCMTSADTIEELWDMIREAKELWLEVALEDGDYIPEPSPVEVEKYSGKFVVRLPRSLHKQLAHRAHQENTSLNQLVVMLLSEGMGRWVERKRGAQVRGYAMGQAIKPIMSETFRKICYTFLEGYHPGPRQEITSNLFLRSDISRFIIVREGSGYEQS